MINEQYRARKDIFRQQLDLQSARIPHIAADEYQFKDFFEAFFKNKSLLKSSPKTIAALLDKIESRYPGGFKWLFWDENGRVINIDSKSMLEGKKAWEGLVFNLMKQFNVLGNAEVFSNTSHFKTSMGASLNVLQRAMGPEHKVEHVYTAREKAIPSKWFGRDCLLHWNIDAISYRYENVPDKIRGGCLVMAFNEALGEEFWLKRLLLRRPRLSSLLPFPMIAMNISERTPLHVEDSVRHPGIAQRLIKAYVERDNNTFEFDQFMVRASAHQENSSIRVFSLVDLSLLRRDRDDQLVLLNFSAVALFLMTLLLSFLLLNRNQYTFSLRKKIVFLFLVAVFLPVLSLISIGRVFLAHEKNRLYESALIRMESGLEALELRYRDTPRLIEKSIYQDVKALVGTGTLTVDGVKSALDKAVEAELFKNYIVGDARGNFVADNWHDIHPAIKNALKLSIKKLIEVEFDLIAAGKSLVSEVVDDEMDDMLSMINADLDLTRPSHLRYYCFQDFHMYFMSMTLHIAQNPHALMLHVPDYFLEKQFVRKEFARNILASGVSRDSSELRSELFFYSRFQAETHMPANTDLFIKLEKEFKRSFGLKVKEVGQVQFDHENFLFMIMPLRTMYKQSYIPCMLTTTKQIEERLYNFRVAIFGLASFASLAAVLLSLVLAGSLLGPIQNIDGAAQMVGKGDLSVVLPDMGTDELGRLSRTFNDMVKGLRERERMQAYVSDSVLEAVQDHAEGSLSAGKTIQATILFSDIRNFTGLTEQYRPDQIFALLNEFLGGVEPLIRENHGRVDKFIGDAVMAVFLEDSIESHSFNAIKAAVAMKKFVKNLNLKRKKEGLFTINIGIGISTGAVLLGDVGSSRRKDLTVIGDEVNLAARLESASKQGQHSRIILSGSTYELVADRVEVAEMPFTEVRGKKQAVKIYELVRLPEA